MEIEQDIARQIVKEMLDTTGLSPTALARKAGLTPSTLTRFLNTESKHTLSYITLSKLARASQYDLRQSLKSSQNAPLQEITQIPLFSFPSLKPGGRLIPFDEIYLRRLTPSKNLGFVQNDNDAMYPTIHNHELVLMDFSINNYAGPLIYVLVRANIPQIRRVELDLSANNYIVRGDNPTYPSAREKDLDIRARAIMVCREI